MSPNSFIKLSKEDCDYLLNLIETMDSQTAYTAKQRAYTIPKLEKIKRDPSGARLAFQDVDYLLELIEDDTLPECEQQREMTRQVLCDIKSLQDARFQREQDIETQRESRRNRRLGPEAALQQKFEHTK